MDAAGLVQLWFDKLELGVTHLLWPAKSPELNMIEWLWPLLECSIWNRYPPQASLQELSQYLHKEWYNIPPNTIQHLYELIPRRIQPVLLSKCGPTPN
ncbi:DDE_3 domain-containing protein [Trichonephila clavipes]|uniref:DDE_3 domain-containing protein n=1 Tax=Trichonephila clavipes TaxID=2585209 RepID=A0A8X6RFZ6_TRICX|nr:DDE_3 domain-containing protein [Trichonephila clavipes]